MPKPTSAFPEHSVEAVWEAGMPSKAEPFRTACAPGIPKCLPPTSHVICHGMRWSMGKLYVYWLIPERVSWMHVERRLCTSLWGYGKKRLFSTWISLQNVQTKYSELFPNSLMFCLPPHSGLQTPQVKWLCYTHLLVLSGAILATGHLLRVSVRQRRQVDMKI